jgi:hypothetical protein
MFELEEVYDEVFSKPSGVSARDLSYVHRPN